MSTLRLIYLIAISVAFILGITLKKHDKKLIILVALIGLGLVTEFFVEINKEENLRFTTESFIYNIYIPLEYFLYTLFFYIINKNIIIRKAILVSVPVFIIVVITMSKFKGETIVNLSTEVYNISSFFTVTWSICTLFALEPIKNIKFTRHPLFWICIGLVIFHSGIIPFNVMLNDLKATDKNLFELSSRIFQKGLNIWLYTCFSIGFICSQKMKKYS